MPVNIYENMRTACKNHGTSLTAVLQKIGHSTGSTGGWKSGQVPKVDVLMVIADELNITLDALVYGEEEANARARRLSPAEKEWLDIIDRIPADKWDICKDFLRTHMSVPDRFSEEASG